MHKFYYDDEILFVGQGAGVLAVEANCGIFRAFEEYGVVPGRAQTSSGSTLFASLYYSQGSVEWMNRLIEDVPVEKLIDFSSLATIQTLAGNVRYMYNNSGLKDLLFKYVNGRAALRVSTSVTELDATLGYRSLMRPAMPGFVLAATSIPFVFPPVAIDGHMYQDGGILNNIPAPSITEYHERQYKHIFVFLAPKSEFKENGFVSAIVNLLNAVMDREYVELESSGFFKLPRVTLIQPESPLSGGLLKYSNKLELRKAVYEQTKEILKNVDLT